MSPDWPGGLVLFVAEIGVDFDVLGPPDLAEHVRAISGRLARASAVA